jgi:hypothetical protein
LNVERSCLTAPLVSARSTPEPVYLIKSITDDGIRTFTAVFSAYHSKNALQESESSLLFRTWWPRICQSSSQSIRYPVYHVSLYHSSWPVSINGTTVFPSQTHFSNTGAALLPPTLRCLQGISALIRSVSASNSFPVPTRCTFPSLVRSKK